MKLTLAIPALVLMVACGSVLPATYTIDDLPELSTLDRSWGCGWGFWAGTSDQTIALRFEYQGDGEPAATVELPSPDWKGTLIEGSDLYANWCDDVIEENEPTPVEHWSLPVVEGTLTLDGEIPEEFQGGPLIGHAANLMVELPDGTIAPLGSIDLANESWGFFAG